MTTHRLFRSAALGVLSTLLIGPTIHAQETAEENPIDELASWSMGPTRAELGDIARVRVPEGFRFAGASDTQRLLEGAGNRVSGDELGLLAPLDLEWFIVFEFSDIGYVRDDDKDELDAAKIFQAIKEGNDEANKYRESIGVAPLHLVGWEIEPRYNAETHHLEWALRAESEGDPVINYNTRLLGRRGVMEANLVIDPEILTQTLPTYQDLLTGFQYGTGESYAEYRQGDKIAKYGLAALVVGGAAVGAAKLGLFTAIAVFLKKAWKLVVIAVVGAAAFVRKLLFGEKPRTADDQ